MMRLDTLPSEPFASATEHMAAEFRWLDARIGDYLRRLREEGRFDESPLRGLRIDEQKVQAGLSPARPAGALPLDRLREIIDQRAAAGPPPPLYRIAESFRLSPIERSALLVAAAPALDNRYRTALALAQNDATRRTATPDLLIELLDPVGRFELLADFSPEAPLFRHRLLSYPDKAEAPLADRAITVDDRVVLALLDREGGLPELLAQALTTLDTELEDWAADLLEMPQVSSSIWLFDSARDRGQRALAARRARQTGKALLKLELARLGDIGTREARELLALAQREAILRHAVLHIEAGPLEPASPLAGALSALGWADCPLVITAPAEIGDRIWRANEARSAKIALPPLDAVDRLAWWRRAAPDPDDPHIAHLAWRSHLGPSGIGRRCREGVTQGASAQPPLPAMLRPVIARWKREDLIVSDGLARQLDELGAFVGNWPRVLGEWGYAQSNPQSRHCLALFWGPSGTGKTMAASIVAAVAELPLYRASLASIFDKYVGETEKQIDRLFEAAANAGIALLCDEADALFGARCEGNDVHARYANLTVSYLLQRIEEHEGLVILTSNLPRNMDEAFARRIGHSLAFTLPDMPARLKMWERAIPAQASLRANVDFAALAETFELSGGDIRNASLAAAYLAAAQSEPISMSHLLRAVERELEKAGRTPIAADFGRLGAAR